jgi:hypothetical protein
MDLLDEVKQEVERDKIRSFFAKNYKHLISILTVFVLVFAGAFIFNNYQTAKNLKSYQDFHDNSSMSFENEITIDSDSSSIDVIHLINKYSYLASTGEANNASKLLNDLDYNNIEYAPFKELLFIYDNNRDGQESSAPIFITESDFLNIIKLINSNDLTTAKSKLSDLLIEPNVSEVIKNKAQELMKLVQFKLDEKSS